MIGRIVALLCLLASAGTSCADDASAPTTTSSAERLAWRGIERNTSPMADDDAAAVDATFSELVETSGGAIPGLWVGIWSADLGAHVGAYGEAVLGGAGATVDDHGRIGSITRRSPRRLCCSASMAATSSSTTRLPSDSPSWPPPTQR